MTTTTPDEILQRLRCNEKALDAMSLLCKEQSCSPEEIDVDVLSVLTTYRLIRFSRLPVAPMPPSRVVKHFYRIKLTELGDDVCHALMEN